MSPSIQTETSIEEDIQVHNERATIRELIIASSNACGIKERIQAITTLFQYLSSKPDVLRRMPNLRGVCLQKIEEFRQRMEEHSIQYESLKDIARRQYPLLTTFSSESRNSLYDALTYTIEVETEVQRDFEVLAEQMIRFENMINNEGEPTA